MFHLIVFEGRVFYVIWMSTISTGKTLMTGSENGIEKK